MGRSEAMDFHASTSIKKSLREVLRVSLNLFLCPSTEALALAELPVEQLFGDAVGSAMCVMCPAHLT